VLIRIWRDTQHFEVMRWPEAEARPAIGLTQNNKKFGYPSIIRAGNEHF
jgi:hypothetical protein